MKKTSGLDLLDCQIIRYLQQNGRMSAAEIARLTGASSRTVIYRIEQLMDREVLDVTAVVNPQYFGYDLSVDIFCEIELVYLAEAVEVISTFENVAYLAYATGDTELSIQLFFHDSGELHRFMTEKLSTVPGLKRSRSVVVPRRIRDVHQWLPSEVESKLSESRDFVEERA